MTGGEHAGGHVWGPFKPADDLYERHCTRVGCRASQLVTQAAAARVRQVGA